MNALLLGYYGAKNLGDDLMLYCLLAWLKKQSINVTVISENPQDTKERFCVNAIQNIPLFGEWSRYSSWLKGKAIKLIRSVWKSDALIVGGGDLIRDDCGWRVFFYTMEKLMVALILGKKIFLVNTGIGDPKTFYGRLIMKTVLRKCKNIIVRDERSVKICRSFRIKNYCHLPDIVAFFSDFHPASAEKQKSEIVPTKPYLLVCLRAKAGEYNKVGITPVWIKRLAGLLDDYAAKTSHSLVFLPFQSTNENDDNDLHREVFKEMTHKDAARILEWPGKFEILLQIFRHCEGVLAQRLHALILALNFKKQCVAMPYDVKSDELCREFRIPELVMQGNGDTTETDKISILNLLNEYVPMPIAANPWKTCTLISN